jgi:hypothetical protein
MCPPPYFTFKYLTARQIYDAQTGRPVQPPRTRGGPMAFLLCCFERPGGHVGAVKEAPAPKAATRREPSNKNSFTGGAAKTPEAPLPPPPEAPTPKHTFEGGFAGPQEDAVIEPRLLARNSMELDTELIDLSNQWFGAAFMLKKSPTRKVTHALSSANVVSLDSLKLLRPFAQGTTP